MRRSLPAFSLMEVMVALGISLAIMSAASVSTIAIYRQFNETTARVRIDAEAKVLGEYIVSYFRQSGGDVVRPWMSTRIVNSTTGSDQFVGAEYNENFPSCPIVDVNTAGTTVEFQTDGGGTCCYNATVQDRQIMLVDKRSRRWILRHISAIDTVGCTATVAAGLTGVLDNPPTTPPDFIDGTGVIVDVARIRHDEMENNLVVDTDPDTDNVFNTRIVAPDIYGLQFSIGFDFDPVDGMLRDDASGSDEWLYNSVGDTEDPLAPVPVGAGRQDLRLVGVGFISGWTTARTTNTAKVFDGPTLSQSKVQLRVHRSTAYFRNDFTFQ